MRKKIIIDKTLRYIVTVDNMSDDDALDLGNNIIANDITSEFGGEMVTATVKIENDTVGYRNDLN